MTPPNIYIKLTDRDPAHGSVATSGVLNVFSPAAPVANADTLTTNEDTQGIASVLVNDTDINGDVLFATGIASGPSHGSAFVSGNAVHYTPAANYNGADSLTYTLYDGTYSSTGTVSVTVTPVPDDPVAVNDSTSVNEDSSVTVSVLTNDYDVDGNALAIQSLGNPVHGSASIVGSQVSYTPSANYNGSDSFTYVINDGTGRTDSATVSVTVNSVPDAPNPPTGLLTDSKVNPDNVSSYLPRFGWVFTDPDQADVGSDNQSAYEIRLGTAPGTSNAWDSGKQTSLVSSAPYAGVELPPNVTYYWSVRVWDKTDLVGAYSADATFVILDIGLRLWDGTSVIRVAADRVGPGYPLRIFANGVIYGIILVDPADPSASRIRIMTAAGIKALKKM